MSKSSLPTSTTAFLSLVKGQSTIANAASIVAADRFDSAEHSVADSSVNTAGALDTARALDTDSADNTDSADSLDNAANRESESSFETITTASAVADSTADSNGDDQRLFADPLSCRALWLAVYFPQLALEMPVISSASADMELGASQLSPVQDELPQQNQQKSSHSSDRVVQPLSPCMVAVEKVQGRSLVQSVSDRAAGYGIYVGMSLNAAYSLYAGLQVRCYDEAQQRRYMEHMAQWAMRFSSQVSVADSAVLLLEIKGSLRYYGGMQALLQNFQQQLAGYRSHKIQLAVTPTAAASMLLAKSQSQDVVLSDYRRLRSALASVYINALPLSRKLKQQLRRLGLRRLQDLWRLPRQDLSRRYGEALVVYLDALTGMNSEMLDYYRMPDHFTSQWHLDYETKDAAALTRIVRNLLEKLEEYLIQCDYHIHGYSVELLSGKKKPHVIKIGLRKPGRQLSHLLSLFEEQLKRLSIHDKIATVKLRSHHLVKATVRSAMLAFSPEFVQSQGDTAIEIDELLDLIQARLGQTAVKSVHAVPDHRPEFAGTASPAKTQLRTAKETRRGTAVRQATAAKSDGMHWRQRPLWLLPDPYPLRTQQQQPVYGDILQLVEGPERIEAAWWSEADVRRDYYYALTPNGQRLWIYQELNAPYKWYLHGFFA